MMVFSIVRTLNESRNIRRFIKSHEQFSDKILVADGGSTDDTINICREYDFVDVLPFDGRIECADGTFRNPENSHFNFLVKWAESCGADWIVQNDCDHEPNPAIRKYFRDILSSTDSGIVKALLLYTYKQNGYFPKLNDYKSPEYVLAWKPSVYKIEYDESNTTSPVHKNFDIHGNVLVLSHPPFAVLHHGHQDDKHIEEKRLRYMNYGWSVPHPLVSGGELRPIPEWVFEIPEDDVSSWSSNFEERG